MSRKRPITFKIKSYNPNKQRPINRTVRYKPSTGVSDEQNPVSLSIYTETKELAGIVESEDGATTSAEGNRYLKLKSTEQEQWRELRDKLLKVAIGKELPSSHICQDCAEDCPNPIRCEDCEPYLNICEDCEGKRHTNFLHKPEIFLVSI